MRQTFSDVLYEIQKELFKPFGKKFENERRAPLTGYSALNSGDRFIKPRRDKTLEVISDEIFSSNGKRDANGPDLGTFAANLEEVKVLPPEYRPVPNSQLKKYTKESFSKSVEIAKEEFLKKNPREDKKAVEKAGSRPVKSKTVIYTNHENLIPPKPEPKIKARK